MGDIEGHAPITPQHRVLSIGGNVLFVTMVAAMITIALVKQGVGAYAISWKALGAILWTGLLMAGGLAYATSAVHLGWRANLVSSVTAVLAWTPWVYLMVTSLDPAPWLTVAAFLVFIGVAAWLQPAVAREREARHRAAGPVTFSWPGVVVRLIFVAGMLGGLVALYAHALD